jgi:hypothetical protein
MPATNGRAALELVEGVVEQTNPNGIRVVGTWLNVSKYRPLDPPVVGTRVKCEADTRGFIHSLEVLEAVTQSLAASSGRDDRITRLAVLKASAEFLGLMSQTREEVRGDHVLVLAEKWLAWVEQAGSYTGT